MHYNNNINGSIVIIKTGRNAKYTKMQTIIIDGFSFAEVCDARGLTITILLCHEPVTCFYNLDAVFSSFIIN